MIDSEGGLACGRRNAKRVGRSKSLRSGRRDEFGERVEIVFKRVLKNENVDFK